MRQLPCSLWFELPAPEDRGVGYSIFIRHLSCKDCNIYKSKRKYKKLQFFYNSCFQNPIYLRRVRVTAVSLAFVPLQEVLLCLFPVSLCSSFQCILGSVEAIHQPHHEVGDLRADGHNVWPLVWIWTQAPERKSPKVCWRLTDFKLL